ncbi:MAG: DUF1565 domain-containing protein [Xanthomonadales bacterium]|jgi:hypothetical protein|nr:DUF1565 domain-containing protein [Xanthomonadales bacterium]
MDTKRPLKIGLVAGLLAGCMAIHGMAATLYVATDGSDAQGDGSANNPWRTLTHAVDQAEAGDLVLVRPGTYNGRQSLRARFDQPVSVRSEIPYAARLRHDAGAALIVFTGRNLVIEGFDIAHAPGNTTGLVVQIQDLLGDFNGSNNGSDAVVSDIVLRNNIIHSSTNNDLLKINNGAERIRVEGNLFFNQQGSDEHIDINSVIDVEVADNIFLNTAARPDTSSYVVIKDSNGASDTVLGASHIRVRRNVFLNWYGSSGQGFLRVGEDGTPNFEARDVLIENNLMLGNSGALMRAPLTIQGSSDVTFRNNTIVGDLPARSYAGRLIAGTNNRRNENLRFFNNIYADPTGTMGSEAFSGVDLFDAPVDQTASATLDRNLYWNGQNPVPVDAGQFLDLADDASALLADPRLPALAGLVPPVWDGTAFADGSPTIRAAFLRLVETYGTPLPGSPVVDTADPTSSASEDILGQPRGSAPDLGAVELPEIGELLFRNGFEAP